jgi:hypothetical protein
MSATPAVEPAALVGITCAEATRLLGATGPHLVYRLAAQGYIRLVPRPGQPPLYRADDVARIMAERQGGAA